MPQALLIIELLLRYGPALAREVAALFGKKEITLDDWNRVFDMADEPYGLTPDAGILALGKVGGTTPDAITPTDAPPGAIVIVKVIPAVGDRETWCNADGDCWVVRRSTMTQNGKLWTASGGMKFYLAV